MQSARPLLGGLVLAVVFAAGWWLGAGRVQGQWDAAELQRERAALTLLAQDRRRQAEQSDKFLAQQRELQARAPVLLPELRNELQAPVPCLAGASAVPLADVPVPAGALERLRRAGADPRAD